jgi:outer membrane protein TolC
MKALRFLFVSLFIFTGVAYCEMLTLNEYLDMVIKNNSELRSAQLSIDAVNGKLAEIEKFYSYSLSAGVNYLDDRSGRPYNPSVRMDDMSKLSYDAGISKQFATGTQVSLGLNGSLGRYKYAPGSVAKNHDLSDIAPFVKLQQSLWKDINGGSTKAGIAKSKASAKSALYLLEYKKQNILLNVKLAYWNLSYAKTVIAFRKMSLTRAEKILDWTTRRYNMDLAGKSDLLQSQIAVKLGKLNLKLAYEDENKANRVFNQHLNIKDDKIKYNLENFKNKGNDFKGSKMLSKKDIRADVLSSLEDAQSSLYDQIAHDKSSGADLVLSGQFVLNGVEQALSDAVQHITNGDKPSYSIGLKYTLPLDFKLRKTVNQGYEAAKNSARKSAEYAAIQENNDWFQLVDNWNNAKLRLDLAIEIEKMQQQRQEEDKNLLRKGRTTTNLVLQSEQALDDATLNVLKNILELIQIYEKASAFYGCQL